MLGYLFSPSLSYQNSRFWPFKFWKLAPATNSWVRGPSVQDRELQHRLNSHGIEAFRLRLACSTGLHMYPACVSCDSLSFHGHMRPIYNSSVLNIHTLLCFVSVSLVSTNNALVLQNEETMGNHALFVLLNKLIQEITLSKNYSCSLVFLHK